MEKDNIKILIADPEELVRDLVVKYLEKFSYRNVVTAGEYEEAVKHLKKERFDLLITSYFLKQGGNGLDLIEIASKIAPKTKVILFTCYDVPSFLPKDFKYHFHFIRKFDFLNAAPTKILADLVQKALEEEKQEAQETKEEENKG